MSEEIKEFSFENEEYRQTYWHTCSHIMAQAVKRLWPEVKLAIGPSIKEGWYYDMDAPFAFTPEHMTEIEAEMRKICKEKLKLERFELPREEAIKFMEEKGEPYKVELIQDLPCFLSCYRGCLVNMDRIHKTLEDSFLLDNQEVVQIRKRGANAIKKEYLNYLFS